MSDPEEYYCNQCDCTFEVKIIEYHPPGVLGEQAELGVTHCPCCGEALDAEEL
jgi:hypothetical protein